MSISLGALHVDLKVNNAQFVDGMTKAAVYSKAFGKDLQNSFSRVGELFRPLGEVGEKISAMFSAVGSSSRGAFAEIGRSGALLGGLAALTGGASALGGSMFALAAKSADVGAKIFEASEKTGISAEQLSALMAITKQVGGDFDSLSNALARAGVNLQKAIIDPGSKAGVILSQVLGGGANLAAERLLPMGDRLQSVVKHIFAMTNEGDRNVVMATLFGKSWMENVTVLKILAEEGYGPATEEAKRFGEFYGKTAAGQAMQFKIALHELTGELSGLGLVLGQELIPMMSGFATGVQGMIPTLEAWGLKAAAIASLMTGGPADAMKLWRMADAKLKESYESQNAFLIRIDALTKGQKADAAGDALSKGTKAKTDALANLISRETEQLALLNANGVLEARLSVEYHHQVEEIQKLVAAGGSFKEGLAAQGLALDIYKKKLSDIKPVIPQVPGLQEPLGEAPELKMAGLPAGLMSAPAEMVSKTIGELAKLPMASENARLSQQALRLEAALSADSFRKLAKAFPDLTEGMVAALPAGQRMIAMLTKMDALGNFSNQFKEMTDRLIVEGDNLGGSLVKVMESSIGRIEDQFAEMVVKGKSNFHDLFQSIEMEAIKMMEQKAVSTLLKKLSGSEDDNSDGGGGGGGGGGGIGIFSILGSMFGGAKAFGGDVSPGKAYLVGEKHPELFLPRQSGTIVPSLANRSRPQPVFNMVMNVSTPDADSFGRSQSQILGDAYRHLALAHARNS